MYIISNCFVINYLYKVNNKTDESSISSVQTVANLKFIFQLGAQILIE